MTISLPETSKKMKSLDIIAAFLILVLTFSCKMPEGGIGSLQGVVTDMDGLPLESVAVVYGDSAVYTDGAGAYLYEAIPEGLQGISFMLDGYRGTVRQVNIPHGQTGTCDVALDIYTSGWAVGAGDSGYGTILYTSDAGRSWTRQGNTVMVPDVTLRDVCAVSDRSCWVVGDVDTFHRRTVILRTDDGGQNWTNQGVSLSGTEPVNLSAVISLDGVSAWAAAADTCLILRTDNSGSTWSVCRTSETAVRFSSVTTNDGQNIWCCGTGTDGSAVLEYSADGGLTWNTVSMAMAYSGQRPEDISVTPSGVLYMAGTGTMGTVRSEDGGRSWTRVLESAADLVSIDVCGEEVVRVCGADGLLYISSDGFGTVSRLTPAFDSYPGGTLSSVSFLRDSRRGVLSVKSVSGASGNILYTEDGGNSWTGSTVPFSFSIEALDFVGGFD